MHRTGRPGEQCRHRRRGQHDQGGQHCLGKEGHYCSGTQMPAAHSVPFSSSLFNPGLRRQLLRRLRPLHRRHPPPGEDQGQHCVHVIGAGCEHENDNTLYLTRRIIVTQKCFETLKTASKAYPTMASYCASKAAIDMLSKTIAVEEGPKVKGRHQGRIFFKKNIFTFLHFYIFTSLATLSTSKPPSLSSFRGKLHKTYIITLM